MRFQKSTSSIWEMVHYGMSSENTKDFPLARSSSRTRASAACQSASVPQRPRHEAARDKACRDFRKSPESLLEVSAPGGSDVETELPAVDQGRTAKDARSDGLAQLE